MKMFPTKNIGVWFVNQLQHGFSAWLCVVVGLTSYIGALAVSHANSVIAEVLALNGIGFILLAPFKAFRQQP